MMTATRCRSVLVLLAVVSAVLTWPHAVAIAAAPGPSLRTPDEVLDAAVNCSADTRSRKTVLLVHGTGTTPRETWSWSYQRGLPAAGLAVCTVELPERAVIDMTRTVEYVVNAVRVARQLSGRKVAIIGHSQGGTLPLWATKFWPDVRSAVDDYIGLAPGVNGTQIANAACAPGSCAGVTWQARFGSNFLSRLHQGGLPEGVSYTNVYTEFDQVVVPQPAASHIPGGSNISVQNICPGRPVDHGSIVGDAVAWAVALDALTHPGPADAARVNRDVCRQALLPRADAVGMAINVPQAWANAAVALATQPQVSEEPPLPDYAR